ncbi:cohesin subunit SA-2 isoform X1 [Nerophis lumbriciformis]|uniref:cohesin subunit SA-2 isoform X1 n=1 Tax=Nerophis lumbriciformis TaxID=546530 RepID=UPI002AE04701|nr:cohesin subunit SA-2-like isoform X1 [Nerophis lumbriciformis]XP_061826736.1 cohesin subunit SA-2-like isoform X1 [Nerophis lumbriciformis]
MIPDPVSAAASRPSEQLSNSAHNGDEASAAEESGNENRQKRARRRKRPAEESENVTKSKNAKSRRRYGSVRKRKLPHVEAVTLFDVITMGRSAMRAVIDGWMEAYAADREASLLDLITFFIQCCGCKGVVTAEMCHTKGDSDTMDKMVKELVEDLDEVAGLQYKKFLAFPWILTVTWPMAADSMDYPLIQPGSYGRWFHSELCDFVSVLVSQCQHSVLFDSYLMSTLVSLLAELSDSHIRAFRHTCTLAAVKLLTSLIDVAACLSAGVEKSLELQKAQRPSRLKNQVKQEVTQLQEKKAEIESMMDVIFKAVFLKRHRDVLPEIRSICMEELGLWMRSYSSVFLNDSYLKYMDWMSYDKVPDVRLKCVSGLQNLYGDPELLPQLDLFTSRFKDRMISMTLDKDNEVALQTMKLLLLISKTSQDVLSSDDYSQLLQLVFSSQRPLAATAGELLFFRLLPADNNQEGLNQEDAHRQETLARLKALLQFYQDSKLHNHVVYLVDSLWDCGGTLLKDWPTLTSILLQDPHSPSLGRGLTEAEEALLVEILVASVRQAAEGPVLAGRSGAKKVMSVREKKVQVEDCTNLTQHFLTVLPHLLSEFSGRWDIIASLIRIPQYFVPESPQADKTETISRLLAVMRANLEGHSGADVLDTAARTFLSLCEAETTWCSTARTTRDSMIQCWVDHLKDLLTQSFTGATFSADEETTADILATLKKLRAFHNCHNLTRWNLFDLLSPLLAMEGFQEGAPPAVLKETLQCLCYFVFWSLSTSSETLTSRDKAVTQRVQLRVVSETSHRCLSHSDHSVRQQAFLGVCDILTAHSYQHHVWDPTSWGPLPYTPTPKLQVALLSFVRKNVFVGRDSDEESKVSEELRMQELHARRSTLAAYCKLIIRGVLEISMAADVFAHYAQYHNEFGDIIKETMSSSRQMDKIESARTLVLSLQQLFERLKREQESGGTPRPHQRVQTFSGIKELARRFAVSFSDLVKFRECVVLIHRSGIEFVFQDFVQTPEGSTPARLSYLSVLAEFSSKLLKPDKRTLLSYLHKHTCEHLLDLREDRWQPLLFYRASLLADVEEAASHGSSDRKQTGRAASSKNKQGSKAGAPQSSSEVQVVHRFSNPSHKTQDPRRPSPTQEGVLSSCLQNTDDPDLDDPGHDQDDVDVEV